MNSSYVSFSRLNPFNSQGKMCLHLDRVYEYLFKGDTRPIMAEIDLTDKCPLSCKWCISENFHGTKNSLDIDKLEGFLHDFRAMGGKAVTFSGGGEPTSYDHFQEAVTTAHQLGLNLGLMTCGVYSGSNHTRLIGEYFDWARVSIDTVDPQKYREWKGANALSQVLENVKALREYPVKVGANCNVAPGLSVRDAQDFIERLTPIVDYIQFRPVLPRNFKDEDVDLNLEVWAYLRSLSPESHPNVNLSDDKYEEAVSNNFFQFRSCEGHFFEPVLHADGSVAVCMYWPSNPDFIFGNINNDRFTDIWKSKRRRDVIEKVRKVDYKARCQRCCKLEEINKLIDYITHPGEVTDPNFL